MATIGWIDETEVQNEAERICTAYNQDWAPQDKTIINRCTQAAYNQIVSVLVGRGFSLAQINTWNQREDYQRDIALCWALKKMGFERGDEQDWINDFCKSDELATVNLVDDDGGEIEPSGEPEEVFSSFDLEQINDDLDITLP
jgi:hypothetical protein